MQLEQANERHQNWIQCSVFDLARNFDGINLLTEINTPPVTQFSRVSTYDMLMPDALSTKSVDTEMTSAVLFMGLSAVNPINTEVTFAPYFEINYADSSKAYVSMDINTPDQSTDHDPNLEDSIISERLKDTLIRNWMTLDSHLLDDIFTREELINRRNERVRLMGYKFGEGTPNTIFLDCMNEHRGNISRVSLHMGMDYNKFQQGDQFSFSPILEIQLNSTLNHEEIGKIHEFGARYEATAKASTIVIEYITPCPTTC
ncbi:hypothetical protein [Reichenbachiella sp. MSK19-1]|uniref:hypothetical protein n=1 Tax=Reichenbachiella sp. MSK19-1 TaxID=1897631 RepID=UPI000E6D5993|nr:hypothetical protein [Reichenbachiella sp. MSK19-1]RJE75047.1 hypothetical protein BGP76_18210 [Reichenbachiella sp. MSK19-1]